ncbi:N-acetyltransferase 9 [Perkinsus olseni]|uniref:N-acetyltransferase 9 n=1 Tax=Perkinsus olseni TaxID=32597 RepID=A0A7J6L424_PEROL|nr:N-acetyltransferase 9 [Perkinsus olseni]
MRINEHTRLEGKVCILVPYTKEMVDTYNSWMSGSAELRAETESEPLTLEEEYEMQASWRKDEDKLTFIVLDRDVEPDPNLGTIAAGGGMCGDVNCFVSEIDDDEKYPGRVIREGEISVMTAVSSSRHKGIAREAVTMMEDYCRDNLHIDRFVAKIRLSNHPSRVLFRSLGYEEVKIVKCFNEVHCIKSLI